VSIIIPTYNDWRRLTLCLDALLLQSYPQDLFEVIVVNNNPSDKMPVEFSIPSNCIIIDEIKAGSYAARNAALKLATGEIIGFTDSDCIPDKFWIENAVNEFRTNPDVKRIGGAIKIFSEHEKPSLVELHDMVFAFKQESIVKSGFAVTGNMFTYKYIFDNVGYFDDTLKSGGDSQWGLKAHKAGYPIIYGRQVIVNHPARDSIRELIVKAKRVGKGIAGFKSSQNMSFTLRLKILYFAIKPKASIYREIKEVLPHLSVIKAFQLTLIRHYIVFVQNITMLINVVKNRV